MTFRKWWKREKYVAIHGQSVRFRIVKYSILIALGIGLYRWNGWTGVWVTFLLLFFVGIGVHFLFRWKTKAWTESWGLYKKIDLPK